MQLAGNFGEPRPNHFHGGIDIKTEREVNLGVYSIADGYISSAIVEKYGYGRAILVTHPNGYTSCYVHLNRFTPQIEAAVRKWQYQHQQFACDVKFRPGEFPIKKGQFIALSGNTGSSQGPHIHLEMHKTTNGNLYDPLNFLRVSLKTRLLLLFIHLSPILNREKEYSNTVQTPVSSLLTKDISKHGERWALV